VKPLRLSVWVAGLLLAAQAPAAAPAIDPDRFLAHVKYLASEQLKGRGNGTPELEAAARYIAAEFRAQGLVPAAGGGSYLQEFDVTAAPRVGSATRLRWSDGASAHELKRDTEFTPLNFSSSAAVKAGVVFAGYGITAKEYHYDDYDGVDARGKIVVILRHEPREFEDAQFMAGRVYTVHSQLPWKAANARAHGAAAVLYVNDLPNHTGDSDEFEPFGRTVGPGGAGIAFVQVKGAVAEQLLATAGKSLKNLVADTDKDLRPRSFAFPPSVRVEIETEMKGERRSVHNVAGYRQGATGEYIVIGAHYDHIGLGEQFSMAPSEAGKIHYGADDNASGTSGVIELARYLARRPRHKRGFLFLAFAGEELGLLGSSHWVRHAGLPMEKAVAMVNLDMVGRIRDGKVQVCGEPNAGMRRTLDRVRGRYKLKLEYSEPPGASASDYSSFAAKPMPVLFFFSGLHPDYHTPADTWDKIDAAGTAELLRLVADLSERLADATRLGEEN
jgi:hypothetical protein